MIDEPPSIEMSVQPSGFGKDRIGAWLPPVIAALLFAAAVGVFHRELQAVHYHEVRAALAALPLDAVLWALVFTAANYLVLSAYDQLAFRHVGSRVGAWRIGLTASLSYALSNSIGFAVLSGTAVRHRFYSRWGVSVADLARIVVFNSTTYWLGLLALAGGSLAFAPHLPLDGGFPHAGLAWLGGLCLALVATYFLLATLRRAPFHVRGFAMHVPGPALALAQLLISMADWALAAAVLYTLLPQGGPSYGVLLGAFLAAQVLGIVSHVPGGLGVFEGTMLVLLAPYLPADRIVAALLLFRLIYYVIPLTLALLALLADELRSRQARLFELGQAFARVSQHLAPRVLALFTFMAGVLLLISGATPAEHARLRVLAEMLPLAVFEASHFLGSLVGVALLVLAQAVSRRIRLAYDLVLAALAAGIAASLLKAGDWEEALVLAVLLAAFVPSRSFFDRRAALFDTRFSPGWIVAIVTAFGAAVWLGIFAFRHVEYSHELWWQVALDHDAPRFMRASLGAAVALLGFALWRLLHPLAPGTAPPGADALAAAARVIDAQPHTLPQLVWLRDKALLFDSTRTAFLMYGVHGRTWAAVGDPVGPPAAAPGLVRAFVERADDHGGVPVFYQVRPAQLSLYADFGLSFAKLGEEARVPLQDFSLTGSRHKGLRATVNRLEREGARFRVVEANEVAAILPQLKAVSDDWLLRKSASEKGFSLGFFDADYLVRQPVAVIEYAGRIVAFANLLCEASREELSIDLMRFASSAPNGTMDGLFAYLLAWGRERGYRWFNLGMAPLSGLEVSPVSSAWLRLGKVIYRHGEAFYNFEGLRAYKEKFHPVWEPRYIAYPGKASLLLVLADIAALSAGGYWRIFR